MPYTYFDLTSAEIELLKALATAGVYTQQETNNFLLSVRGALQSATTTVTATISSGTASITRPERIFIAEIDTQGQASTDTLDSLEPATGVTFYPGDIVILKAASAARIVSVESDSDKINAKSNYNLLEPTGRLGLIYVQYTGGEYQWAEMFRSDADGSVVANTLLLQSDALQSITAGGEITIANSIIPIQSERTAETLATEDMVLTATGTNAVVTVFVDEGNGPFSIGSVTLSGTPAIPAAMTSIVAAITAAATGYTAVDDGVDTITVTAIVGSGATANTYTLTYSATSTFAATIAGSFSGGVDGVDQDDTLTVINGTQEGQMIIMYNVMTANKITCSGANFSSNFVLAPSPNGYVVLFIINAVAVPFGKCCQRETTATRWVDPNGVTGFALKNILYPYQTIGAAIAASASLDCVEVLPNGSLNYNEKNFLKAASYTGLHFYKLAAAQYTGAAEGSLFDDGAANGCNAPSYMNITSDQVALLGSGSNVFTVFDNQSSAGASNSGCFYLENTSRLRVSGGHWRGLDYCAKVTSGTLEISDALITGKLIITGGILMLRNCRIYSTTIIQIDVQGGTLVLDNCLIDQNYNNAAGHGITCSAGNIYFKGINRIYTVNAGAQSINCTAATGAKLIGELWATNAIGGAGVITDAITAAPLVLTVQNANVE